MKIVEGQQGNKMIELRVRFWTNNIAKGDNMVAPKHCWDSGMVAMDRNTLHEITGREQMPFHSLMTLSHSIEKLLLRNGIKLHMNHRTKKLYSEE